MPTDYERRVVGFFDRPCWARSEEET